MDVEAGNRPVLRVRWENGVEGVSLRFAPEGSIRLVHRDAECRILFEWP